MCRTAEEGGFSELVYTPADGETLTFGDLFRKDLRTFTNLYDFLSQLLDFEDTDVAKRAIFYRVLWEVTKQDERSETPDLSTVDLLDIVSRPRGPAADIQLASGEARELNPLSAAGSGMHRDPKLVALEEVVNRLNEIFGQDLPKDIRENFVTSQLNSLQQDDRLVAQAKNNSEAQFMVSPDLKNSVLSAAFRNQADQGQMVDHLFSDERVQLEVVKLLGRALFQSVQEVR